MTVISSPAFLCARWAFAAYLSVALLGINQIFWGFYGAGENAATPFSPLVVAAGSAVGFFALALLVFAAIMTVAAIALWIRTRAHDERSVLNLEAESGTWSRTEIDPASREPLSRSIRLSLGASTVVATIAAVAIGLFHSYVWNPLSKVPSRSLDEIYAEMDAANELSSEYFSWVWATFWPLVAIAFMVLTASSIFARRITVRGMIAGGLAIVSLTIAFHWTTGFSMGMGLADTFFVGGGDSASAGKLLALFGQLCAVAALFLTIAPRRTNAGRLPEQTTRVVES